jgi:flagellin
MKLINNYISSLSAQSTLKASGRESSVAMQQLSSGKRINSSKNDAAGLDVAARMAKNIKSFNQAVRNAGDGISLIQVAEGATHEITSMLQRMSELAVQSSAATYSATQRSYQDQEFQQLKQGIIQISDTCEWNGFTLLNGRATGDNTPVNSEELMPTVNSVQGSSTQTESAEITFKALNTGQSVTVSGLTYLASTFNSAEDVAKAFSNLSPNTNVNNIPNENKLKGTFKGTLIGFGSKAQNSVINIDSQKFSTYIEFFDRNQSGRN